MPDQDLRKTIRTALEVVRTATGHSADELFGHRVLGRLTHLPAPAAHAAGVLEGAALALGLTPFELLDELGLEWSCAPTGSATAS